jgi:hypothetical protein
MDIAAPGKTPVAASVVAPHPAPTAARPASLPVRPAPAAPASATAPLAPLPSRPAAAKKQSARAPQAPRTPVALITVTVFVMLVLSTLAVTVYLTSKTA